MRGARRGSGPQKRASRKTPRARGSPLSGAGQFLDPPHDEVALDPAQAVDEQRAVEVIDLVLQRPGQQRRALDALFDAVAVEPFDHQPRGRTTVALKPGML